MAWPGPITAITLFVEDLAATKQFYLDVFALPVVYEDDNSAVFKFGETLINLLKVTEAEALIEPARWAAATPEPACNSPSRLTMSMRCAPN